MFSIIMAKDNTITIMMICDDIKNDNANSKGSTTTVMV